MDICRDCVFTKEAGKFCANPVVITDYEGPGGGTPMSLLTEGIVKTVHIRQFAGSTECKGYSEKPGAGDGWFHVGYAPPEPYHGCHAVALANSQRPDPFYFWAFWLEFAVIIGLLIVIWRGLA